MAWITEKGKPGSGSRFQVRWRNAEGRTQSQSFPTIEQAESFAEDRRRSERRVANALKRMPKPVGFNPIFAEPFTTEADEYRFENYLRRIIEQDAELRQASREMYLGGLKNHIEGTTLGLSDIRSVTPDMIRDFWIGIANKGVGTRRNTGLLVKKALNRAEFDGIIDASPWRRTGIKLPPKGRREEIVPLSVGEIEALATAARCERDRLAILVMGYAGLRAGEVGGLRLQDVDFARCKLSIRQQVVQTHREKRIAPLKTRSARRTIEVACFLTDELKAFVEAVPPATDGLIFHAANGSLCAHAAINHGVQRAAARAGLRPIHSHMLRHSAVSLLIDAGANPKAIQAFVGHARIQETLDTYGHLFDYAGSALAASMERRREHHRRSRAS